MSSRKCLGAEGGFQLTASKNPGLQSCRQKEILPKRLGADSSAVDALDENVVYQNLSRGPG